MKWSKRLTRSTVELLALALLLSDLLFLKIRILAFISLAYFLLDFIAYRCEAVFNHRASRGLREGMTLAHIRSVEKKYSLRDDFNTFEKHAFVRPPLDRHFYYAKYERVRELLVAYGSRGGQWLDLGCGFGQDVLYLAQHLSERIVGLELDDIKLLEARRILQKHGGFNKVALCAGDATRPPFRPNVFDTILMSEVLEHLIDPEPGLQTCHTLLKPQGVLIVSTSSSHNLGYTLNPFYILERCVSLLEDSLLPPYHALHARFEYNRKRPEPEYAIHHRFSQKQLRTMMVRHGFSILWEGTFEIEIFPYLYIELFSNGNVDKIRKIVGPIETVLERIPILNRFGQHLLVVAQKSSY